jgi:hypothetical protein
MLAVLQQGRGGCLGSKSAAAAARVPRAAGAAGMGAGRASDAVGDAGRPGVQVMAGSLRNGLVGGGMGQKHSLL